MSKDDLSDEANFVIRLQLNDELRIKSINKFFSLLLFEDNNGDITTKFFKYIQDEHKHLIDTYLEKSILTSVEEFMESPIHKNRFLHYINNDEPTIKLNFIKKYKEQIKVLKILEKHPKLKEDLKEVELLSKEIADKIDIINLFDDSGVKKSRKIKKSRKSKSRKSKKSRKSRKKSSRK